MSTKSFLMEHGLEPALIDVKLQSKKMLNNINSALEGNIIDIPMITTHLKTGGKVYPGDKAVVIDAGGTNYRAGLATYNGKTFDISNLFISKMPGTDAPVDFDYFISFVADSIMSTISETDIIGFCFSYAAEITPEIDAIVGDMDKEVIINNCRGRLLGSSLISVLEKRGYKNKKCIVINDTVATLLGNPASYDAEKYSGAMGMICGTGVNTCGLHNNVLYNLESGFYKGMPQGDYDLALDRESAQPGEKLMEKMCSGVYIGKIAKKALSLDNNVDGSTVDYLSNNGTDFEKEICKAIFERSARCMASNILALMKLSDCGCEKPFCICAEGSLIEKSSHFLPFLKDALDKNCGDMKYEIVLGHETTLPGSAFAAITNK